MAMESYLSVITLNVNGLTAPTKRQRLAEWIQKQDPYIQCYVPAWMGGRFGGEWVRVYVWLSPLLFT